MRDRTDTSNIYQEGTIVTAKVDPTLKLIIMKYYQHIYYCAIVGFPKRKHFAYFERELNAPIVFDQSLQFTRVTEKPNFVRKNSY